MKREHLAFLAGGFAFGILFGFALSYAVQQQPELSGQMAAATMEGPRGPMAPGGGAGPGPAGGGAPMVARINELKQALQDDPENLPALLELADLYQRVGEWEPAVGFYERAVEIEPTRPSLWVNLGLCLRGMGRIDEALDSFARAHEVDPAHWQALFNTVVVAGLDAGRFDLAREALQRIERLTPAPAELGPDELGRLREWLAQSEAAAARQQEEGS